uniref:Uncharacterized protein n=1 Tax=Astyanax mexicanus TaxID=7994 RepID=A0A8B9HVG0_ASTMX
MATQCGGKADSLGSGSSSGSGEQIKAMLRRCRGRPRLSDSDRAQRRLESRKKYDVRRVYLGESHRIWSDLRRRSSLSDAGLAEYLILLNSAYGERYQRRHAAHGHQYLFIICLYLCYACLYLGISACTCLYLLISVLCLFRPVCACLYHIFIFTYLLYIIYF